NCEISNNSFQLCWKNFIQGQDELLPIGIQNFNGLGLEAKVNNFRTVFSATAENNIAMMSAFTNLSSSVVFRNNSASHLSILYQSEYNNPNTRLYCNRGEHLYIADWAI